MSVPPTSCGSSLQLGSVSGSQATAHGTSGADPRRQGYRPSYRGPSGRHRLTQLGSSAEHPIRSSSAARAMPDRGGGPQPRPAPGGHRPHCGRSCTDLRADRLARPVRPCRAQDRPDHLDPRRGGRRRVDRGAARPRTGRPRDRHRSCLGPGGCAGARRGRVRGPAGRPAGGGWRGRRGVRCNWGARSSNAQPRWCAPAERWSRS